MALLKTALHFPLIAVPPQQLIVVHQPCILHRHDFGSQLVLADGCITHIGTFLFLRDNLVQAVQLLLQRFYAFHKL